MTKFLIDEDGVKKLQKMWEWWVKIGSKLLPNTHRRRAIMGGGETTTRLAQIAEIAKSQSYIKASLLNESTGIAVTEGADFEITVHARICSGARLDRVSPKPGIGDIFSVQQQVHDNDGTPEQRWEFVQNFHATAAYIGENP